MNNNKKNKTIATTWLSGQCSCTLVIPKDFAREAGLDIPTKVIVEITPERVLIIRKLEIDGL
jgi:hypothetical protein